VFDLFSSVFFSFRFEMEVLDSNYGFLDEDASDWSLDSFAPPMKEELLNMPEELSSPTSLNLYMDDDNLNNSGVPTFDNSIFKQMHVNNNCMMTGQTKKVRAFVPPTLRNDEYEMVCNFLFICNVFFQRWCFVMRP
jgi:hypothetical protein